MGNTQESNGCLVAWSSSDTDSSKSCVFIDEAGINISMKSSRAWAPRRQMQPPKAKKILGGYLPHYLSEQFWALVKGKVKRPKLEDTEILQNRTIDAANEFSIQHLQNII
ncbi:hypothetical protein RO3G_10988 [Rhizopus delemar RA 99-880]|uniref:Uncharacterized protein n=1 Tax=Rhizopus delemar (strain RA 99-880 / ATCC MYA-4621 / FGSC 9543 / NRRL 43880) TaxID=246409 RepID=I1CCU7_RHIO9|nr:hypothetical protein RO3G_10988 [Rhizopus delemar RA 99-880]|eukprot:EIE86277.1 hypothetical protein RO3G_10988 [Rhizopus delemar RA 99-880]